MTSSIRNGTPNQFTVVYDVNVSTLTSKVEGLVATRTHNEQQPVSRYVLLVAPNDECYIRSTA